MKKNPAEYEALTKEFYEITKEKGCNTQLCKYVWMVLIAMSRGYGFNQSHTLAYSLVGLQEMNLAYKYPIIFWNCANLISDSTGSEDDVELEEEEETEEIEYDDNTNVFDEEEDEDEIEETDDISAEEKKTKKAKKAKASNYGKIATAIGKMKADGVAISLPSINSSKFTFSPDVDKNIIYYGLGGIARINREITEKIINNRPYISFNDFMSRIKLTRPQMVNLIKSGAFDEFGDRVELMKRYITIKSEPKTRLTLQNMPTLIKMNLIPEELDFERRIYNFTKYIRKKENKSTLLGGSYRFDEKAYSFYSNNGFDMDYLSFYDGQAYIKASIWDNIYSKRMDKVREYIKKNYDELLKKINQKLFDELWQKGCDGDLSKWEMDSVSFYHHNHELQNVKKGLYGIVDYSTLPDEPTVIDIMPIKTKEGEVRHIPIYEISRIMGTVLDRDKNKKTVTLLTTDGVVDVKIYGAVYTIYDKQISEKDEITGKKKVIEKSWFSRGNKIIVTGIKRENMFFAKKYKRTPYHLVELIESVDENGSIVSRTERAGEVE